MLLQDYYDLQRAIKEDLMAARESGNKYQGYMDTLLKNHKMVMDMQRILHDPSLVVAINRKFDTWLRQKGVDRQFLDRLVEYQDEYLKELVEERHDPS
jgi:hypothetical protein